MRTVVKCFYTTPLSDECVRVRDIVRQILLNVGLTPLEMFQTHDEYVGVCWTCDRLMMEVMRRIVQRVRGVTVRKVKSETIIIKDVKSRWIIRIECTDIR